MMYFLKYLVRPIWFFLSNAWALYKVKRTFPQVNFGDSVRILNSRFEGVSSIAGGTLLSDSFVGRFSYIGSGCFLCRVKIGRYSCLGPDVYIGLASHPVEDFVSIHPLFYAVRSKVGNTFVNYQKFVEESSPVIIGNDVWIGARVIIPGGISIGDGAIIAAGSVVTKNVAPYTIVGGVPARVIRSRFEPSDVEKLLNFRWWDKSEKWLRQNVDLFEDIEALIYALEGEK